MCLVSILSEPPSNIPSEKIGQWLSMRGGGKKWESERLCIIPKNNLRLILGQWVFEFS